MSKEIKFKQLKFSLKKEMFDMNVDNSALYETNAVEMYKKALFGEESARARYRQITGIKDRFKLGLNEFESVIKPGDCDFDPSDSTISQKTFEVCPIMIGTSICVDSLETSFVSDQLRKGSANFVEPQPFMNYFYETLSDEVNQELEILTFQGQLSGGATGPNAYLNSCDGLEYQLENDTDVLKPSATASAVTSTNIISKLVEARNKIPKGVRAKSDFAYQVSTNVYDAYMDAISENKVSGQYYVEAIDLKFQGVPVVRIDGASDNVIIAGQLSNFLNINDLANDANGFNVVDFMKTTLQRKIGVRTDAKFKVSFLRGQEIYFHKP